MLKCWDAVAVENPAYPGTPDVNYVEGWIELKHKDYWPQVGEDRNILIPHFTQQQRVWLIKRWHRKGNCFLLLQVAQSWLLFDGLTAGNIVGRCTKQELYDHAVETTEKLQKGDLVKWLERHHQQKIYF